MKGKDFPRPATLLRLASILQLPFDQLVETSSPGKPIVAFRKKQTPSPDVFIAACEHAFQSDFFHALKRMINEKDTGSSYLRQIMDVSVHDAKALYEELRH